MSDLDVLKRALVSRGLMAEGLPTPAPLPSHRPWFVSLVLGSAGWLAGVFGLICIGLIFRPDTALELTSAGVLMLAAAGGLYALDRENAFFDQLALALSIAGQLAMTGAAWDITNSVAGTVALVALMQVVLVLLLPNRLAKFLAAFFACIAWAFAVRFAWWDAEEFSLRLVPPALASWFVVWIPVIAGAHALVRTEARWMASGMQYLARPALTGLLLSLAFGTWASLPFSSAHLWSASVETDWLAMWPLLSAAAALFAAICAFRIRNRALIGAAIGGALLHVVHFYFLLGTTLLMKSCIMLIVGVLLSVTAALLSRRTRDPSGAEA